MTSQVALVDGPRHASRVALVDPRELIARSHLFDAVWYLSQLGDGPLPVDPIGHYLEVGSREGRLPNPLFSPSWYRARNPDVVAAGHEPLVHYIQHGAGEMHGGRLGRDPHPAFSTSWYLAHNPRAASSGLNPLAHYLVFGGRERTDPHPLFKTDWYDGQSPDAVRARSNPLLHYLQTWSRQRVDPHPLFDGGFYLEHAPHLVRGVLSPLEDYLTRGPTDGQLRPHALFDTAFYFSQVGCEGMSPLEHYVRQGGSCELRPHPLFDTLWYLQRHPEVRSGARPALVHYVMEGVGAASEPNFMFDSVWYARRHGLAVAGAWALKHFVEHAGRLGSAHPCFDGSWYFAEYIDAEATGQGALEHFLRSGEAEGRRPHPLFEGDWCRASRGRAASHVRRYLEGEEGVGGASPQPLLHEAWYRARYPSAGEGPALRVYLEHGAPNRHDPNPFFDAGYYAKVHADVARAGMEPLTHFATYGAIEGRRPAHFFDTAWYAAEQRIDPRRQNPLAHFLHVGYAAGAAPSFAATPQGWPTAVEPDVFNAQRPLGAYLEAIGGHARAVLAAEVLKRSAGDYAPWLAALLGGLQRAGLPQTGEAPQVTVILPVYNGLHFTLGALLSIALNPPDAPFEIIVIDNVSTDATQRTLSRLPGIRYVRNAENVGYLRSNNKAAALARGEYLFLLNNDTMVCPQWMDELKQTFDENDEVGLAGSKLIYPDGVLQEAGGIIWRDASAWNYGRMGDPAAPEVNYVRQTDYCSAAAIMVPKRLWDEVGGFDEAFVPSYCEDSDLALRIRERGYSVLYAPLSVVIHFEGMTQGSDTSTGIKAYQITNTQKLRDRWRPRLQSYQEPGQDLDHAKDRGLTRRVLFLDNCTPQPDEDAGSITVTNLMLLLKNSGFQVTFIPRDNYLYLSNYTKNLQRRGIEVLYGPYCGDVREHLKAHGGRYDLVVMYRPDSYRFHAEDVARWCPRAATIYHTCDLHYLRMARQAELKHDAGMAAAAEEMKTLEFAAMRNTGLTIVHSAEEHKLLARELPKAQTKVFNWAIPIAGTTVPFEDRRDVIFVGGYAHTPNVDAVVFFVDEILPHVLRREPDLQFHIVGSRPPPAVTALAGLNVQVHGFVADIEPMLNSARVAVAPLRAGAGIKGKIATSMSLGLPTVVTTVGAEGMHLTHEVDVLVADEPARFAAQLLRLYRDASLWRRLSRGSLVYSERSFGFTAAREIFDDILENVGFAPPPRRPPLRLVAPTSVRLSAAEPLSPFAVAASRAEYARAQRSPEARRAVDRDRLILKDRPVSRAWTFPGWSAPAHEFVNLRVEPRGGAAHARKLATQLACPMTGLVSRERLLGEHLLRVRGDLPVAARLLSFESAAFNDWLRELMPSASITAGRRTPAELARGGQYDAILGAGGRIGSTQMSELLGAAEALLRLSGRLLISAPERGSDRAWKSIVRACLAVAERPEDHGFSHASLAHYHSPEYGHLGRDLWVFDAQR